MTSDTPEASHKFDAFLAIVLGIAAIAAAWSAFQSGSLGGDAQTLQNQSIKTSDEASQQFTDGTQQRATDQTLFLEYAKAQQEGNEDLAGYLKESLMDENLAAAVTWWEDQPDTEDAAASPFVEENPNYVVAGHREGERLDEKADQEFAQAGDLNDRSGKFELATVLLAVALFLFGVSSILRVRSIRYGVAVVGVGILAIALFRVIDLGYYGGMSDPPVTTSDASGSGSGADLDAGGLPTVEPPSPAIASQPPAASAASAPTGEHDPAPLAASPPSPEPHPGSVELSSPTAAGSPVDNWSTLGVVAMVMAGIGALVLGTSYAVRRT